MNDTNIPRIETAEAARIKINGQHYDWFRGNGYLGLYNHAEILQAACDATMQYGMKLRSKRTIGCHPCLLTLEQNARTYFNTPSIAYFNSGYAGNSVLLAALQGQFDQIFVDQQSHLSIMDAIKSCNVPVIEFNHRSPDDLQQRLQKHLKAKQVPLVISDSLFPITGELAPVTQYHQILKAYDHALLCLDDAHGAGVLGENGRGILEHCKLTSAGNNIGLNTYTCTTMSKAFGSYGGLIACDQQLQNNINKYAGVCNGASPPPPAMTAASACALAIVMRQPELRQQLTNNIATVQHGLKNLGFTIDTTSPTPIICLPLKQHPDLKGFAEHLLKQQHIAVLELDTGYSNIPPGGALVFTLFATHQPKQIKRLLNAFQVHA